MGHDLILPYSSVYTVWLIFFFGGGGLAVHFKPRPPHFEVSRSQKLDTPLNGRSASRRGRYLERAQQTHGMKVCALSGIRIHDPNNQAAVYLRLRPHGLRDRPLGWHSASTPNLRFPRGFTLSGQGNVEIVPWNRLWCVCPHLFIYHKCSTLHNLIRWCSIIK